MFVWSCSTSTRRRTASYVCRTCSASAGSATCSPSSEVFVRRPCSFRPRSVTTTSSSVSPPTKRDAPSRIPYWSTKRRRRGLSAAARMRLRSTPGSDGLEHAVEQCVELGSLPGGEPPQRRTHVFADRHSTPDEDVLESGMPREAVELRPQRARVDVLPANGGDDDFGERRGKGRDRADRTCVPARP